MNAAAFDFDIDVIDSLEATEIFGKAFDFENDGPADGRRSQLQRRTRGMHLGPAAPALGRGIDESPDTIGHEADDQDDR